jgi:hypothetical protein
MRLHVRLSRSLLVALLFAVLVPLVAQAYGAGIARDQSCGGCHGNKATGSLSVSLSGPAQLAAGATASYTLTIVDPGGMAGGSFGVGSSNGGSFVSATDANTHQLNGNVTHLNAYASPPAGNIGDWSYNFDLTAPGLAGTTITVSFAGLAFDGDFSNNGDIWNIGTYLVSVVPEPATGLLVSLGVGMLALAGRRRKA